MGVDTHVGIPTHASIGRRRWVLAEHRERITHGGQSRRGSSGSRAAADTDAHSPTTASPRPPRAKRACKIRSLARASPILHRGKRIAQIGSENVAQHKRGRRIQECGETEIPVRTQEPSQSGGDGSTRPHTPNPALFSAINRGANGEEKKKQRRRERGLASLASSPFVARLLAWLRRLTLRANTSRSRNAVRADEE